MTNISAVTACNSAKTIYTITDTSTNKGDATGKRVMLIAFDQSLLFDSGPGVDVNVNTFNIPIGVNWITSSAILSVQVYISYNEFGGTVTGPLQDNYYLPTISNIKQ